MIKTLLKRLFSDSQWKRGVAARDFLCAWMADRIVQATHVLPDRIQILAASKMKIIRKMDYPRGDIFLHIDSDIESNVRLRSCEKEPETISWIETSFQPGDVFYDIGANIGAYTLVACTYFKGAVTSFAFDPAFSNFAQLCRNLILNRCGPSAIPLQIAFSETTGIKTFNYTTLTSGAALHALGDSIDYKNERFEPILQQQVLAYSLDDFIEAFHVPAPNHIKIDVDGTELKILQGAQRTLENPALRSVLVEVDEGDDGAKQLIQYLEGKGFAFCSKHKFSWGGDVGPYSKAFNYIFQRQKTIQRQ